MDVSDGLAGDLAKLCRASGVAAEIEVARVPLSDAARAAIAKEPALIETIVTGGDDYEVLACVPAGKVEALRQQASAAGVAVTEIGTVVPGQGDARFLDRTASRAPSRIPRSAISEAAAMSLRASRWPRFTATLYSGEKGRARHARHDRLGDRPTAKDYTPADNPRFVKLHRRFPTVAYLRKHARRKLPHFAFEYCDGGAGADGGIARNWSALDAVELVPRYGVTTALPPVDVELFGKRYSAPIGVAPMGGPSLVFPGADQYLAAAAQRARVPYTLGLVGGMTVERAAEIAPDVLWFQLYRCSRNEHAIGFDLVKRAEACGVHVLVLTARRAGAHHALARGRGRHHLAVPARPAHARRHCDLARLSAGRCCSTASRASAISSPIPRTTPT